jgi:hypothetical protein
MKDRYFTGAREGPEPRLAVEERVVAGPDTDPLVEPGLGDDVRGRRHRPHPAAVGHLDRRPGPSRRRGDEIDVQELAEAVHGIEELAALRVLDAEDLQNRVEAELEAFEEIDLGDDLDAGPARQLERGRGQADVERVIADVELLLERKGHPFQGRHLRPFRAVEADDPFFAPVVKADLVAGERGIDVDHLAGLAGLELQTGFVALGQERQQAAVDRALDGERARVVAVKDGRGLVAFGRGDGGPGGVGLDGDVRGEEGRGAADEQALDLVLDPVLFVDQLELVPLVGVAGGEGDPASADDDQRRLGAGKVVIEDRRVGEGEAHVGVDDLDPAGPHGPVAGDPDLVQPGHGSASLEAGDGPGPAAACQGQGPGLDGGRLVVLKKGLDEDTGGTGRGRPDAGHAQGHAGHLEVAEEDAEPGVLIRPEVGLERLKVLGHGPGPEHLLQPLDEGRGGL